MSNNDPIDSWFAVGRTYAYLTVACLDEVSHRPRLPITWRPKHNSTTLHLARSQAPTCRPCQSIDVPPHGSMNAYRDYAGEPDIRGESEMGSRAEAQDTFLVRPTANA